MNFLNSNPNRLFKTKKRIGTLYYYGYTNTSWDYICKTLDTGNFPTNLKGQFAFVYIGKKDWIACVDHLCTTQIFYTNDKIDSNFNNLVSATFDLHQNTDNLKQLEILKSHTVGPETPYKEILRIEPETYVKNGNVYRYSDILNEPLHNLKIDNVYEQFVTACKKYPLDESTLLFSGGKDSGWLALLLKHLNYDIDLVHIHSPNSRNNIDFHTVKAYEQECNFPIKYYKIDILSKPNDTFWKNAQFLTKTQAASLGKGKIKLTGEVGDTIGGFLGSVGNLGANKLVPNEDDFIRCFISKQHTWGKKGSQRNINIVEKYKDTEAYQQIFEHFRAKLKRIEQPYNYKYYNFMLNEFNSHRLYAESQDTNNTWYNIFADYEIQNSFINSLWCDKHHSSIKKWHLYRIGQEKFSNWTDISWRFPTVGMGIPDAGLFRKFTTV